QAVVGVRGRVINQQRAAHVHRETGDGRGSPGAVDGDLSAVVHHDRAGAEPVDGPVGYGAAVYSQRTGERVGGFEHQRTGIGRGADGGVGLDEVAGPADDPVNLQRGTGEVAEGGGCAVERVDGQGLTAVDRHAVGRTAERHGQGVRLGLDGAGGGDRYGVVKGDGAQLGVQGQRAAVDL